MISEPIYEESDEALPDPDAPVSRGEFNAAVQRLDARLDGLREYVDDRFDRLDQRFDKTDEALAKIDGQFDELKHYFDAIVEAIHKDVGGANQDEISGIKTKQGDHEERLATVEQRLGMRPS